MNVWNLDRHILSQMRKHEQKTRWGGLNQVFDGFCTQLVVCCHFGAMFNLLILPNNLLASAIDKVLLWYSHTQTGSWYSGGYSYLTHFDRYLSRRHSLRILESGYWWSPWPSEYHAIFKLGLSCVIFHFGIDLWKFDKVHDSPPLKPQIINSHINIPS